MFFAPQWRRWGVAAVAVCFLPFSKSLRSHFIASGPRNCFLHLPKSLPAHLIPPGPRNCFLHLPKSLPAPLIPPGPKKPEGPNPPLWQQQTTIFRLRIEHCRFQQHMCRLGGTYWRLPMTDRTKIPRACSTGLPSSEEQERSSCPTEQRCKNSYGATWRTFWSSQPSFKPPDWLFEAEEWVNNCWWGWQNRTAPEKLTHLREDTKRKWKTRALSAFGLHLVLEEG